MMAPFDSSGFKSGTGERGEHLPRRGAS